jgi:tetratricopeptide (TPR) repeat protein
MRWIFATAISVLVLTATVSPLLAVDFRGGDDAGVLWDGCKSRTASAKIIIQRCAWGLKSGLGVSNDGTHMDIIANALYRMAVSYRRIGNLELAGRHFDLAIQTISQAIASSPNAELRKGRCWFRAVQNTDLNGAFADCDAALALDSGNATIVEYRGFALYRLGRYQEALSDYNAALAARSGNPDALFVRGIIKKKLGDIVGGDSDITEAKRDNSDIEQIYLDYGVQD